MPERYKTLFSTVVALGLILAVDAEVYSAKVIRQNLAQLTDQAELILMGKVVSVTDGFNEEHLPYTEITLEVKRVIKGPTPANQRKSIWDHPQGESASSDRTYTFRQFGLLQPRDVGNGIKSVLMMGGFPHYTVNEDVIVFLYKQAAQSGFRTTVGLFQGKFTIKNGKMVNAINNQFLFEDMNLEQGALSNGEVQMLREQSGPVDVNMCMDLISRAVKNGFFDKPQLDQPRR